MSALDDIISQNSAPSTGSALDAVIARNSGGAAQMQASPAAAPAADQTPWGSLTRQFGLTARAGVTSLTSIPSMFGDAANGAINLGIHGINAAAGTHISPLQMPSAMVDKAMNSAGVPQPQNDTERLVQAGASAMGGTAPFVRAGQVLAKNAAPLAQAIGSGMAALPGMQMTGAAGAGMSGELARQSDVGPLGQLGFGLLGGVAGAVAPSAGLALARGVRGTANNIAGAVQPILSPQRYVGRGLADAIGSDNAPTVAANIRAAQEYVPGSLPTTAQAGGGSTLVATEKALRNGDPIFQTAFADRASENNGARWDVLNGVARTPEDLSNAIADRAALTQPAYDAAHAQVVPLNDGLTQLAKRPAVSQAMAAADLLSKNEGVPIQWPTPENPMISGKALDYTSRALGDQIGAAQTAGRSEEVRALTGAQSQLKDWMAQHVPGTREAAADYAALSSPVSTMQAGQQIAGKLGTAALDTNKIPMLQLPGYRSALSQAIKGQEFGIDEGAHKALQGIGQDLQQATVSNSLRSPGSDTAYNLSANGWLARQMYGQKLDGATSLGRGLASFGAAVTGHPWVGLGLLSQAGKLGQMVGGRLAPELRGLLLDPQSLLPYLDSVKPKNVPKSLLQGLRSDVSQGLLGSATASRASP